MVSSNLPKQKGYYENKKEGLPLALIVAFLIGAAVVCYFGLGFVGQLFCNGFNAVVDR